MIIIGTLKSSRPWCNVEKWRFSFSEFIWRKSLTVNINLFQLMLLAGEVYSEHAWWRWTAVGLKLWMWCFDNCITIYLLRYTKRYRKSDDDILGRTQCRYGPRKLKMVFEYDICSSIGTSPSKTDTYSSISKTSIQATLEIYNSTSWFKNCSTEGAFGKREREWGGFALVIWITVFISIALVHTIGILNINNLPETAIFHSYKHVVV